MRNISLTSILMRLIIEANISFNHLPTTTQAHKENNTHLPCTETQTILKREGIQKGQLYMAAGSPFSRFYSRLTEAVDKSIGWHRLPLPLALLILVGLRFRLRAKNLYDTYSGKREP